MFWSRVRNDGAFRSLPLWIAVTALNTSVLVGLIAFRSAGGQPSAAGARQLLLVLWLAVSIHLLLGRVRTRSHRLELALPIPARELWLSHSLAAILAGAVVLVASLGVVALHAALLHDLPGGRALDLEIRPLVAPLIAALTLAIALLQGLQPGLWKLRGRGRARALVVGILAAVLAILLALSEWPALATFVCLLLAIAVGWHTYRSLPPVYSLVPLEAEADDQPAVRAPAALSPVEGTYEPRDRPAATPLVAILFSVLHHAPPWKRFVPWVLYSFILLLGFVLAGGLDPFIETELLRFIYIPLGSYMLLSGAGLLTYSLHRLDALPISRRLIFGVLTLPTLVFFLLGWSGGRLLLAATERPRPTVAYRIEGTQQWVEVRPAFMRWAWGGEVPRLSAPWGEEHQAWHEALFEGSRAILYSPYNTPEETSAEFEALMTSRAIEDIYGASIPHTFILDRYFVVEGDRLVGLAADGLTILEDFPELQAPPTGPETPVFLILVVVPWLVLLWLFMCTFRATASERLPRVVYWSSLAVLLGLIMAQIAAALSGWYRLNVAKGFFEIFIGRLGADAVGSIAVWAASVVFILAAYWLALSQFLRAELPTSPIRCTLVAWGRDDSEAL